MRTGCWVSAIVALGTIASAVPTHAQRPMPVPVATLRPTDHQVRAGDGVTIEATFCPKGQTPTEVAQRTVRDGESGAAAPFVALNLAAISLDQTDTGASFTVTAEEARTTLWFRLQCDDGRSATTTQSVTVYPPLGEFWWMFNAPGRFVATPGSALQLRMASMDCDTSFIAEVSLYGPDGGEALLHVDAWFDNDGSVAFPLALPAQLPLGVYVAQVSCSSLKRSGITDGVPVHVVAGPGELTPTGGGSGVATAAAMVLLLGVALLLCSRLGRRPSVTNAG